MSDTTTELNSLEQRVSEATQDAEQNPVTGSHEVRLGLTTLDEINQHLRNVGRVATDILIDTYVADLVTMRVKVYGETVHRNKGKVLRICCSGRVSYDEHPLIVDIFMKDGVIVQDDELSPNSESWDMSDDERSPFSELTLNALYEQAKAKQGQDMDHFVSYVHNEPAGLHSRLAT